MKPRQFFGTAPRRAGAALFSLLLAGCQVDKAHPIAPPGSNTPVMRLSELGIFQGDPADQIPRQDFVPYDVIAPLYSDGASKYRFVYVPPGQKLRATDDRWEVPVGTYFVKTFYFPNDARDPSKGRKLIETRFLIKRADGYEFSTYVWDDNQRDAVASGGNVDVPIDWIDAGGTEHRGHDHVPGTSQCESCHQDRALGIRSRQMDRAQAYPDGTHGQIEHLIARGILDAPPAHRDPLVDPFGDAALDTRARSYLDANCAHCHGDGGSAADTGLFWDREHTDAANLAKCRDTASVDGRDRVIVPGNPDQSEFLARMLSSDPFVRMPRGPNHVPDRAGIAVLSAWVSAMTPGGCP